MLARIPVARSNLVPASSAASGNSACRAVAPGASSSAPTNTSVSSCQISIPTVVCRSGIAATAAALARSATMLVVRKPTRSTITPPKKVASTIGTKLATTARLVSAALPVVTSTNQGIASWATWLPEREIASATYSA